MNGCRWLNQTMHDDDTNTTTTTLACAETKYNSTTKGFDTKKQFSSFKSDKFTINTCNESLDNTTSAVVEQQAEPQSILQRESNNMTIQSDVGINPRTSVANPLLQVVDDERTGTEQNDADRTDNRDNTSIHSKLSLQLASITCSREELVKDTSHELSQMEEKHTTTTTVQSKPTGLAINRDLTISTESYNYNHMTSNMCPNQTQNIHAHSGSNSNGGRDQINCDPPPRQSLTTTSDDVTGLPGLPAAVAISNNIAVGTSSSTSHANNSSNSHNLVGMYHDNQSTTIAPGILHPLFSNSVQSPKHTNCELSASESTYKFIPSDIADLHVTTSIASSLIPPVDGEGTDSSIVKSLKKPTTATSKKPIESQESTQVVDEKLVQARRPLTDLYGPFVCHTTDTCLQNARDRLRKALDQTYTLRKAFTNRVYTKYRVCLRPAHSPDHVIAAILADPKGTDERLQTEAAWIREEKEIEKKETTRLNAEMSASKEKKEELGNVDNAEQLMYYTAGLNLVILPEDQLPPEQHYIYSERCPINPITGQRVKGISQAAAIAGEVIIDRTRKAAAMKADRPKQQPFFGVSEHISVTDSQNNHFPEISQHGQLGATAPSSSTGEISRMPIKMDTRLTAINPNLDDCDMLLKVPRTRHPALSFSVPSLTSLNPIFDELRSNNTKPGAATSWLIANSAYSHFQKSSQLRAKSDLLMAKRRFGNETIAQNRIHDLLVHRNHLSTSKWSILPNIPKLEERSSRQPLQVLSLSHAVDNKMMSSLQGVLTEFLADSRNKIRNNTFSVSKVGLLRKRKLVDVTQLDERSGTARKRLIVSVLSAIGLIRNTKPSDLDNGTLLTPPVSKRLEPLLSDRMLTRRSILEASHATVLELAKIKRDIETSGTTIICEDGSTILNKAAVTTLEQQIPNVAVSQNLPSAKGVQASFHPPFWDSSALSKSNLDATGGCPQDVLIGHALIENGQSDIGDNQQQSRPAYHFFHGVSINGTSDFSTLQETLPSANGDFLPTVPSTLTNDQAKLIFLCQFHKLTNLSTDMAMLSTALTYLRDLSATIPISNHFVSSFVTRELDRRFPSTLEAKMVPIEMIVASIKSWLWAKQSRIFQTVLCQNKKVDDDQECNRIVQLVVIVAIKALVLEVSESMTKSIGAFWDAVKAQKANPNRNGILETIGPYRLQRLELWVSTVVSAALSETLFIDPVLNFLLPNIHDAFKSLDDARSLAFRSKARERTLLLSFLARRSVINDTCASAFVGTVVRGGEALGHDQIFEEVQNEKAMASSMLPYDIFTEENGLWENPTRPTHGFRAGMTGEELFNRAHARAEIHLSLTKMQERHHILGGASSRGPYGEVDTNHVVAVSAPEIAQEKHQPHPSSPRPNLKRRVSAIVEAYFPPGTGSAAAKNATVYDPRHISVPLEWDNRSMSRTPYGVHSWAGRKRLIDQTASSRLVEPRVVKPKSESSSSDLARRTTTHLINFSSSSHEINWADVADVFHLVKLPKRTAARSHSSSLHNSLDSKIYAPFFRPAETNCVCAVADDSDSSAEDLSDESVIRNHQAILDKMRDSLDKVNEARRKQQEYRKNRQK